MWGVIDVAEVAGRLLWINPAQDDFWSAPVDLVVEGKDRLRICGGNGYGSHGEPLDYTVADGRVVSIRGSSGMAWHPVDKVASAAETGEPVRLGSPMAG